MGAIYGQKSSFSATDGNLRINIEDLIEKYEDFKFPALKRLSGNIFKKDVLSHKYEWSERDLRPIKTTAVNQVSAAAQAVAVVDAGVFNVNDVIEVVRTGEKLRVTSTEGAGTLPTIERGFEGTLSAIIIEGDSLVRIGKAAPEGAEFGTAITVSGEDIYNYTQVRDDTVEMSDGQYKGFIRGDETQSEGIQRVQQELMEGQHLELFLGNRYRNAAQKISTTGGIKYFTDTYAPDNVIDFGGAATWNSDINALNKFEDAVEKLSDKMGGKPVIYATYKALRKFRLIQDDTIRTQKGDKSRGIGVVDTLLTGMGELDIVQVIDRTGLLNDYIFFVDEKNVGIKARKGRGWFTEHLPKTKDGHTWSVVGEYTNKFRLPKASLAYVHNLGL